MTGKEDRKLAEADRALIRAIDTDDDAGINSALDAGANPNLSGLEPGSLPLLSAAVSTPDEALVMRLLSIKADPNVRDDDRHFTPIHYLALFGCIPEQHRMLDAIVGAGGDVNAPTDNGLRPLDLATNQENRDMVHHLLRLGARSERRATAARIKRLLEEGPRHR